VSVGSTLGKEPKPTNATAATSEIHPVGRPAPRPWPPPTGIRRTTAAAKVGATSSDLSPSSGTNTTAVLTASARRPGSAGGASVSTGTPPGYSPSQV